MLSEIRLADPYVCRRRASNSTRVKVDQTRLQGSGNCIAFISRYRYCWESGRTFGYRVSGHSPNWSAPPSARRISNANVQHPRPVAITRAFFLLQTPTSFSLFVLPSSFSCSSASLAPPFLFFPIRSPSGKEVETFPTFSLSSTRPRAQFCRKIPLRDLLWRT